MIHDRLATRRALGAMVITASGMLFAAACAPVETAVVAEPGQAYALPLG